eukprot:TRINITY_DN35207_c0_g1_i1.p1 TRINITY_DN35207_c0_g1~~TRINITY_DN35207_c0_g1_i1.p1  ORF type:complete len:423 (+),score=97.62 TRINITY_DN35207_c0_g1_i1:30-1298(+)
MPSAPAAPKAKAAPIARPSWDYEWKIQNREYGGDEKVRREEARRQEAEERRLAREAGYKADLGEAAAYWEHVAESSTTGGKGGGKGKAGKSSKGGKSSGKGAAHRASPSNGGYQQRPDTSDAWGRWNPGSAAPPGGQASSSRPGYVVSSSRDSGRPATSNGGDRWKHDGWDAYHTGNGREASNGKQPDHGGKDAWSSQTWWDEPQAWSSHSWHDSSSGSGGDSKQGWWERESAEEEYCWAAEGMDDSTLKRRLDSQLASASASSARRVDLSSNRITDAGIASLVSCLRSKGRCCCRELLLQANPLQKPMGLIELLKDERVGLKAGFTVLAISPAVSAEFFWRIMEACYNARPRPPLRLGFDGELSEEQFKVVLKARENGVSVAACAWSGSAKELTSNLAEHEDKDLALLLPPRSCHELQRTL